LLRLSYLWCQVEDLTYHVTYHVWPHQPVIDQQGLGLRGLVHKEAHKEAAVLHRKFSL